MCQAIDEMIQESRAEGRAEGKAEGEAKGRAEGKAEGEVKGRTDAFIGLVKDGLLAIEEAAKRAELSVDEFKKLMDNNE